MSALQLFEGTWELRTNHSSDIGRFSRLVAAISVSDQTLQIARTWGAGGYAHEDRRELIVDSVPHAYAVDDSVVAESAMMNLRYVEGGRRTVTTRMVEPQDPGGALLVAAEETGYIRTSQGTRQMTVEHRLSLNGEHDLLTWTIRRETRHLPITYVLKRRGVKEAYSVRLSDDWEVDGGLDLNALLISIQGNANRMAPQLYFVYPETWDFRFTPSVYEFLRDRRNYTFTELAGPQEALETFRESVGGYVVWDPSVRTSLIVAFTIAGLSDSVVVSPRLAAHAEDAGLSLTKDLRGVYTGMTDADVYRSAKDEYFADCSKSGAVWLGGEHGRIMKPGVADWGMANRMFCTDLSTNPAHVEERELATELLGELEPNSLIFGWHSYRKDTEEQHVTLCSSFGHRVEGLHTLPNMSFSCHIPTSPGFSFRNNHTVAVDEKPTPERKVYISCLQTDCLGIGSWTRPGRGEIPYAWEVTMNWVWLAPAMMEYFYSQATPNDYFIGALSGPGYMYPKAVPPDKLPPIIRRAADLMDTLDLRVFEIMDYSEGFFHMGTVDLPQAIVDAYYQNMPNAIGFLNGYGPANTFAVRNGRPLLSFDYYIHPTTPEAEVSQDLEELAQLNPDRPYFLLLHVRNFADIRRVIRILDALGEEFEVVAMDRFVKLAAASPTYVETLR